MNTNDVKSVWALNKESAISQSTIIIVWFDYLDGLHMDAFSIFILKVLCLEFDPKWDEQMNEWKIYIYAFISFIAVTMEEECDLG